MNISKNGLNLIKQFEGCSLKAYKCFPQEKYYTIGYGHYGSDVKGDMTITQSKADSLLKQDIKKYESCVNKYNKIYNFNQNEFDALVSFAFNIGNIRQLTKNGTRNRNEIVRYITQYNKSNGTVIPGLTKRRCAEKCLFLTLPDNKQKSYEEIAKEVIAGKWGNGQSRKNKLEASGYNYKEVQKIVNKLLTK